MHVEATDLLIGRVDVDLVGPDQSPLQEIALLVLPQRQESTSGALPVRSGGPSQSVFQAFRYELDPNNIQRRFLARHAGTARFACGGFLIRCAE